jgi:hypothetical protein
MVPMRLGVLAVVVLPAAAGAELSPLSCKLEQICRTGETCDTWDSAFRLDPAEGGYRAVFENDDPVLLQQAGPAGAGFTSFATTIPRSASGAIPGSFSDSVTVLLSLYAGGDFALSVHEQADKPFVETGFGHCAGIP